MVCVTAAFYGLIRHQLASTSTETIRYALIPIFGVLTYGTLTTLTNRWTLVVNEAGFSVSHGPLPVRGAERIARGDIASCYYYAITVRADEGDGWVHISTVTGIETRSGRLVPTHLDFANTAEARASAGEMAHVLGVAVHPLAEGKVDQLDKVQSWFWPSVCAVALVAGVAWEVAWRSGWLAPAM